MISAAIRVRLEMYPGESYTFDSIVATVPEPSTVALLLLAGMAALRLRRR